MSIKSFNESFRRQYQKDTVKKKNSSLYNRIVESVERASKNRGSGQNLSQYEQLIQEAIESSTGKNWYDVADVNMQQILFEESDIKNAAKRLLHINESESAGAGEYEYKGHTVKFNNMGTAQIIDNKTGKLVRSGVSDAEAEEWIDSVTNESLKEEKIPETGEKVRTPRGIFSVTSFKKDELEKQGYGYHHSSDDGKYSIYGNGTDAYAVKNESVREDTEKTSKGKWVNRGDSGKTHGTFKTKKEAEAQRKAMFARGYKAESLSPIATKGITNGLSMNIYSIDNGIDDEVTYGYSDEDKTYTANIEYKDDGTFFVDKDGTKHNIDDFMRVDEDWTSVYKNFEKIVDKYLPDEDKIQSEVENLYNQHKGEPDWDKAWEKWNVTDKVDTVDEALKTNSKKAMDNLKQYIMDNCDPEDYGVSVPSDFAGVATLILDTFRKEKYSSKEDYRYYHNNERAAFEDWMQGLPSIFDPGYYYQGSAVEDLGNILEETDEEKEKYSEEQAENILTQLIYRELKKAERKTESKRTKRCGKSLTEMKVTEDIDLRDFEFWSGARDNVKYLTDDELDTIQSILEDSYPDGMSKTDINDFFWFESDTIAEWLGYDNFEQIINRDDDKGVDESCLKNKRKIKEGLTPDKKDYLEEYLFDEYVRSGYFPTYDDINDEVMDLSQYDYDSAVKMVKKVIDNVNLDKNIYDGYLQLHDNYTGWKLDNPDKSDEEFSSLVEDAADQFNIITGEELYLLGRSGRHVCVELNYDNANNYDELKNTALKLEQWGIDKFNSNTSTDDYDEFDSDLASYYYDESFNRKHRTLRESSDMRKYSQKELRDLVRDGYAEDITQTDEETIQDIWHRCNKIGYSTGIYGLNGGLLEDPETGDKYVVIGRGTNLFRLF